MSTSTNQTTDTRSPFAPHTLFRTFALAEAVSWALLLLGMVIKYTGHTPILVKIAGPIHGFAFLAFCALAALSAINNKWKAGTTLFAFISAIIPLLTIVFERRVTAQGQLSPLWRFRDTDEQPSTAAERALHWYVTKPALSLGVTIVVLGAIFLILLALGGPATFAKPH